MSSRHSYWLVFIFITLLSACATTPSDSEIASIRASARAADQALRMVGKPYRYGGNTPRGFDCSGLVHFSYAKVGINLPRTTRGLRQQSQPVTPRDLRRGDLLFFNQEGKRSSHVAIYLDDDQFVHAPSSGKQVGVASLSEPYWRKHFVGARRPDVD